MTHVRCFEPSPARGCGLYLQPAQITCLPSLHYRRRGPRLRPAALRCHPEPGPGFVGDVVEGSVVPRATMPSTRRTGGNLNRMNTYAKCSANPCGMNTSKIMGLKASCNQHLQKKGGRGVLLLPNGHPRGNSTATRASRKSPFPAVAHASKPWETHRNSLPALPDEAVCYALVQNDLALQDRRRSHTDARG
jgi:hypothetical protein